MTEEVVELGLEQNKDRYLVLLFNCLYFDCDIEKTWSILSRNLVFNSLVNKNEFAYLLCISNCCHNVTSELNIWVSESDLKSTKTEFLIQKYELNLLKNNSSEISEDINLEKTLEYCDKILDELYKDSNNVKVHYEDYQWLMRAYDRNHLFYGQKPNLNVHDIENQNFF
ncbi:unnamed protein product [Brachionus calyciflorus]|uniref:Uncharacterized protein n=1 Tax=Brachionus calyciflorus TaxID=104777 RepID=A0A813TL28_9BILA|nr:unnamed protein product [Brachionus calyciflorus]